MRLQVLIEALAGLHHAHELADYDGQSFGLVHRAFTPQNLVVGYDGHVKVLDFGIAKTESEVPDPDTRAGAIKGKVRYISPEQIVGAPPVDRRADVFAAGMILWELAVGESPWTDSSEIAIINKVINNELPSMRQIAPHMPSDIERICSKALMFDREERYATVAEMGSDIEQVLGKLTERVVPRDLGGVVTGHFGDVRTATKRVIEEQLAKSDRGELTPAMIGVPMLRLTAAVADAAPPAPKTRSWLVPAVIAAAIGGGAVALLLSSRHRVDAAVPHPDPQATVVLPRRWPLLPCDGGPPAAPTQVEIHVRAVPASATVYFDDQALSGNPATTTRPADGSLHTVRAEARGYRSRAVQIVVDTGSDLVLTLERAPTGPSHPVPTATATHTGAAAPDCAVPYFIDANGIKKFKPQCI